MLLTECSAFLNEYCFIIFFSDIDVHNELFNGFGVFSTLKVSRYQVLSNLSQKSKKMVEICEHTSESSQFKVKKKSHQNRTKSGH
jgi:hypothetical protein